MIELSGENVMKEYIMPYAVDSDKLVHVRVASLFCEVHERALLWIDLFRKWWLGSSIRAAGAFVVG